MRNSNYLIAAVISMALFITACGGSGSRQTVEIDGSSTVYPLTEAVAEEFRVQNDSVRVTVGSSGTGAGFKKFCRQETDITDASRPIKESERQSCSNSNITPKELTVALDGIAIVVHPENDWISEISVEQLREIWRPDSKISNWSDVHPEWPEEKIRLFGPTTAHGTYDFFTGAIVGESGASRSDYNAVSDYNVAVQGINSDQYALGYFGLAYYEENREQLKLIPVDNGSGAVTPSLETV